MNLFRAEGHARKWRGFTREAEGGLLPLDKMLSAFSIDLFRQRPNGHYVSNLANYRAQFLELLRQISGNDPFWRV
jgi:hypothetical protein